MAKRKVPKSRKRRLLFIGTACVIAFVFFCVNIFTYTYKIVVLTKKQNELANQLEVLKVEKENLEKDIANLQTPEGIANYARQEYLYTRQGEYVIKINNSSDDELEEVQEELDTLGKYKNYMIFASIGFFIIVIIFIRRRN